MGAKLGEGEGS